MTRDKKGMKLSDRLLTQLRNSRQDASLYLVNGFQMKGAVVEFDDAARASFRAVADGLTATWRGTIIPADVYDLALRERNAFRASR